MPWNGAGLFTRLRSWVTDQTNGLSIQADLMDNDTNDIATGIQACLAKNGENTPTANLPMGGFRHTGVADGAARTHYASLGQVQDGSALYCVAAGTANALTLSYTPTITALVNGQRLRFRASATCAAGATTAAVNAISAKSVKRPDGTDPAAGDITNGSEYTLIYNSTSDTLVLIAAPMLATTTETQAGALATKAVTPAGGAATYLAQGKQVMAVLAGAMVPRGTNGPASGSVETTTNKVRVATLDYDPATAEYAQIAVPMPKSWNEGAITARFFASSASGTGGAVFGLRAVAVSSGDALDAAFGTGQTATVTISGAGALYASAETSAVTIAGSPAEGDVVWFEVYRDATNGADTLTTDARLHGVHIYFTVNAATEA